MKQNDEMQVAVRVAAVVVASAVIVAGCGSDDDSLSTPAPTSPAVAAAPTEPPPTVETPVPETPPTVETPVPETPPTVGAAAEEVTDELFPDVLEATAMQGADGTWTFDVTMSSPYDSADRYADAWRVTDTEGTELGVRILAHDHAGEQPFTRSLSGVEVPDSVDSVTIEGRDQINGWGGDTVDVSLGR